MRFDRNRSGRLDYRELRNALRALGLDVTTNESARVLARYDADGSGLMEIDEFERLVRQLGYYRRGFTTYRDRPMYGTVTGAYNVGGPQVVGYHEVPVYEQVVEVEKVVDREVPVPYEVEVPVPYEVERVVEVPYEVPVYVEVPVYMERQVEVRLTDPVVVEPPYDLQYDVPVGTNSYQISSAVLEAFARFDRNRSGRLDYRELREALRALGLDATSSEAARVLAEYDDDGSGLMEIDEFAQLVQRLGYTNVYVGGGYVGGGYVGGGYEVGGYADAVRQTFMRFDRNRSGRLDYRELRSALRALGIDASTNQAARLLASYDADGSGLMEIDEFERLVRRLGYGPRYHGGGMPSGARTGQWQTVTSPGARSRAGLPITPRRSRSAPRMRPATFGGSGGYGGYRPALLDY